MILHTGLPEKSFPSSSCMNLSSMTAGDKEVVERKLPMKPGSSALHHEIWKDHQSPGKMHTEVLQNPHGALVLHMQQTKGKLSKHFMV